MSCQHLTCYAPAGKSWSVATCSGKGFPYIPSSLELSRYCQSPDHRHCPAFPRRQDRENATCLWPELAVVALAQCCRK